jgi:hypothetical protein
MKKEDCKPGVAVNIDRAIWTHYPDSIYCSYWIYYPSGIITHHRIIENDRHNYHYTVEFGKRKKIYQTRSKIGIMLTNGILVYVFPEELTRK